MAASSFGRKRYGFVGRLLVGEKESGFKGDDFVRKVLSEDRTAEGLFKRVEATADEFGGDFAIEATCDGRKVAVVLIGAEDLCVPCVGRKTLARVSEAKRKWPHTAVWFHVKRAEELSTFQRVAHSKDWMRLRVVWHMVDSHKTAFELMKHFCESKDALNGSAQIGHGKDARTTQLLVTEIVAEAFKLDKARAMRRLQTAGTLRALVAETGTDTLSDDEFLSLFK